MPSKTSKKTPIAALPIIPKDILDQFFSGPMTAEAVNAASVAFKKALIEHVAPRNEHKQTHIFTHHSVDGYLYGFQ